MSSVTYQVFDTHRRQPVESLDGLHDPELAENIAGHLNRIALSDARYVVRPQQGLTREDFASFRDQERADRRERNKTDWD